MTNAPPKEPGPTIEARQFVDNIGFGENAALEKLYDQMSTLLIQHLRRRVGTTSAMDLLHDTYVAVVTRLRDHDLRDPKKLPAYIWRIAQNRASVLQGRLRKERSWVDPSNRGDNLFINRAPHPDDDLLLEEARAAIGSALQSMASRDRELLLLFYFVGESENGIKATMNLTDTQFRLVKSRATHRVISRARRLLM